MRYKLVFVEITALMKNLFYLFNIFLLLLIVSGLSNAQTIRIVDGSSGLPVPNVALFNKKRNKAVISDDQGKADIGIFSMSDSVYFQHPSYLRVIYSKEQLEQTGFTILLEREIRMLKEFVIAVNKWEQDKKEVPNEIKTITRSDVQFHNPQTAGDLLAISNAVFLQKSQLGGGSPMIRGFAANSVLLVVDGIRMNNAIYRSGNLQNVISLDANIIKKLEVVYGPGSVVYGSDALGGVMDFHTLDARLSAKKALSVSTNAALRYSTANNEKTGHLDINIGFNKWAFLSSVTYSNYQNLRMGAWNHPSYQRNEYVMRFGIKDSVLVNLDPNVQIFSGYTQLNLMQKIRFSPKKKLDFIYAFHYSASSNIPRYDRLIQYSNEQLKYSEWYYGPQRWMLHSLTARSDNKNIIADNTNFIVAYQNYSESRHDRKLNETFLRHRLENVDIFSLNLDLNKKFGKDHAFYYGVESVFNNVKSTANSENIITGDKVNEATRYPDGINHYTTVAAYTSLKYNITKKITLDAGIRYSYIHLYSTIENNSFYSFPFDNIKITNGALNGSLGLVFRPGKNTQINFNASSGFRAPNLDDVAKVFDSQPGGVVVPNEDLKPEYAYNIDLGLVQNFNNRLKFEITGFYTLLKNAMVRQEFKFNGYDTMVYDGELSKVYALVNAGEATIFGTSMNLEAKLSRAFSLSTDFSYIKGKVKDGSPLRHAPPIYGGFHFLYENTFFKGDFYLLYNGKISNKNLAPDEQTKTHMYELDENGLPFSPAWYTINLKTSIKPTKYVSVQAGIENILNVRYRPYSSGIVFPGRNFFVALKFTIP